MKAIYVKVLKKSNMNVVPYLMFGILAIVYGASIYYVLPWSLLSMDLGMILRVFFCILLGMLLGLCLMAINV